jgi:GNAT superfamily N-acetyltransferase
MELREVTDLDLLKAFHQVQTTGYDHDFVALPCDPMEEFVPLLEGHQPPGEEVTLYVGLAGGEPVATASRVLWTLDNLSSANVDVMVLPEQRRRGYGRQTLTQMLDRVRTAGRSRVFLAAPWLPDGGEGPAFPLLREVGARPVLEDVRRLLDLRSFPIRDPAEPAEGYSLRQWVDTAPDDVVDGVAYLLHRMVLDAPMGEMDYEPEVWDAARYRDSEASARRRNRTRLTTVAMHDATGEVAGLTELALNGDRHDVGYQWNTIVDPRHRGHGLGLVLKEWNHALLVDRFPTVRWVNTWNAQSNSFMIEVNERLGFRRAEHWTEWQLEL